MISKEVIASNREKYYSAIKAFDVAPVEFIESLESKGLFEAPASAYNTHYNAFPGGLVDHLLRVAAYAVKINNTLPDALKQPKESIVKVCLLHCIGKVELYTICKSDWHIKNQGKIYEYNNMTFMTISERTIHYILSFGGVKLSDLEYQAIINHDKPSDNLASEWKTDIIGEILKMAIKLAVFEEKISKETSN